MLSITPATGLLALTVDPTGHGPVPVLVPATSREGSRAPSHVIDTTVADFVAGQHHLTMTTNASGGEVQMTTFHDLGSPILGDHGIFSLTEGQDGTIFAGGMGTGQMVRVNASTMEVKDVNSGNPIVSGETFISALLTGADGTIWGGTGNGYVFRMDPDTEVIQVLNSGNPVDASFVADLTILSDGTIWGTTLTPVLFEIDPSTDVLTTYGDFSGNVPGATRALTTDLFDDVWVGCTDGIDSWLSKVNTTTKVVDWNGVAVVGDGQTKTLVTDPDGYIWGGTEGGTTLFRVDPSGPTVTTYGNPTAAEPDTTAMVMGPDGNIWAGTRFAAHIYQFDHRSGLAVDHGRVITGTVAIRGLVLASDGSIWGGTQVSTGDGEMFRFRPNMGYTQPVQGDTWIGAITFGHDGLIYGATQDDMDLVRGSKMFSYDPANDLMTVLNGSNPMMATETIMTLTTGLDGRVWGGTDPGSYVFSLNTSTMALTFANGSHQVVSGSPISDLVTGLDGTIWGSTVDGYVFRIDPSDGTTTVLNGGNHLMASMISIYDLMVASNGTIWGGGEALSKVFTIDPDTNATTDWGQAVATQNLTFALTEGTDGRIYGATWEMGNGGHVFVLDPQTGVFTDLGVPITTPGQPITRSLVADGLGRVWGGTYSPCAFFSLDEATTTLFETGCQISGYQSIDELIMGPDGTLWGTTQGNRFGGDLPMMFHFTPRGMFTSRNIDLQHHSTVPALDWTETSALNNVSVRFAMRSASTEAGLASALWGPYISTSGQDPSIPDDRWVQYRAEMLKLDMSLGSSAIVEQVDISYKAVPNMTIEKMVDKAVAKRGEEITYTIYFNNTGPVQADNVWVNDTLDLDLVASSDEGNRTGTSWSYPTIGAGTDNNLTITVRINASAVAGGWMNDTANLSFTDMDGENEQNHVSNQVSTLVEEVEMPVITLTLDVDKDNIFPGDELVYTMTVENTGPGLAANMRVTDHLDLKMDVVGSDDEANRTGTTWALGDLMPGEGRTVNLTARAQDSIDTDIHILNKGTVNFTSSLADQLPEVVSNTVLTFVRGGPFPWIEVTKEVNVTKAEPGDAIRYTITLNNTGTVFAPVVTVTDVLSTHLTFMNSSSEANRTGDKWTFLNVTAGSSTTLEIEATVDTGVVNGTIVPNNATVTFENFTAVVGTVTSNTVSTTMSISMEPVMTLQKVADKDLVSPGEEITYTIYFNNTGTGPAAYVAVAEVLPSVHVLFQNTSHPYIRPYQWNFTNVLPGAHYLTITVLVKDTVPKDTYITNQVLVSYADSDGNYLGDLLASVTTICRGGGTGGDTTSPTIIGHTPLRGDIMVPVDTTIEVFFSEPMDHAAVENAFAISPNVEGNISWSGDKMIFTPTKRFKYETTYTVTFSVAAKDLAGNGLANPHLWTFKTKSKSVQTEDQENLICYVLSALAVGAALGGVIFYIAYKRKFDEIEKTVGRQDEEDEEEEPEKNLEDEDHLDEKGEPIEDEEDIEELEVEAGAGPEEALAEEAGPEDVIEEEGPEVEEGPDSEEPEGPEEPERIEEPEEKTTASGSSIEDILKKLKD